MTEISFKSSALIVHCEIKILHMIKLITKIKISFDGYNLIVLLMLRFSAQEVTNTSGKTRISCFEKVLGKLYHTFHLVPISFSSQENRIFRPSPKSDTI